MPRVLQDIAVIPLIEPADHQAGIEAETFNMANAAEVEILLTFGAITGDAVLSLYCGATAAAKTTKIPFRHRLSGADYKAAAADQYAATFTEDADGDLTLTAATYDHRTLRIVLEAAEIPDGKPWITLDLSNAADALLVAGFALASPARYQPALTMVPA